MTTNESNLNAFASILSGLLASGHFTRPPNHENSESTMTRVDYGDDWAADCEGDPSVYRRDVPCAFVAAEELYAAAMAFCKTNP